MSKFEKILKTMKRIFFIILLGVLIIACKTQAQYSMTSTLYQNEQQYKGYLSTGSLEKATTSGQKLLKGVSLLEAYLTASLSGRNGMLDSAKTEFDALYGKTHSHMTFTLTAVSYLDLDSLFINGVKVVSIYPKDSVLNWISDSMPNTTGTGNVLVSGTPTYNQLAIWINDSTIKGVLRVVDTLNNVGLTDGSSLTTGNYNVPLGTYALYGVTTGSSDIGVGAYGGRYATTQSNRLFINSINRTNILGDTTKSIIYGYQDADTLKQKLYVNGYLEVSNGLKVIGNINGAPLPTTASTKTQIDTTIQNFVDTLDYVTTAELTAGLNGLDTSSDSNFVSVTADSIKSGVLRLSSAANIRISSTEIIVKSSSVDGWHFVGTAFYNDNAQGPYISASAIRFIPNRADVNTGISYISADKIGITAGGQQVITAEYAGSKKISYLGDSAISDIAVVAERMYADSIWDGTKWNKKLVSFDALPSDSSLVGMDSSGDPFYFPIENGTIIGSGIDIDVPTVLSAVVANPDSITGTNTKGTYLLPLTRDDSLYVTGNIVASTGITEAMLHNEMYYNGSGAIDISANPQIANGYNGQKIIIIGSSDTNTLTLEDGTGLQTAGGATFVIGIGDVITLIYVEALDLWVEHSRSNN